jgi:hypothetical protein
MPTKASNVALSGRTSPRRFNLLHRLMAVMVEVSGLWKYVTVGVVIEGAVMKAA